MELLRKEFPDLTNKDVMMVGDSVPRDVLPARKLGLRTALCTYGGSADEKAVADYDLSEIDDIIKIIDDA